MNRKLFPVLMICLLFLAGCTPTLTTPQPVLNATEGPVSPLAAQNPTFTPGSILAGDTVSTPDPAPTSALSYPIVDTGQGKCYDNNAEIPCSETNFAGQDAQYTGNAPSYTLSADGLTVTDNVTGLMWVQARGSKMTWDAAVAGASTNRTAGYDDWRMPTIKELYSLIQFNGVNGPDNMVTTGFIPFLDTNYFGFAYGSGTGTERVIDCQDWSATKYVVSTTMNNQATIFGVNFADGRIKGYPQYEPSSGGKIGYLLYARYVRGNPSYGINNFMSNGDGTVTDQATGLTWSQADSGIGLNWPDALAWVQAQNAANHLGYSDWRLPNIKELESIVDYTRSPVTTATAAIDTNYFTSTVITNEAGQPDYPYFWSSTTLLDGGPTPSGTYISFGLAIGYVKGSWIDVHGAGSQKSDIMVGDTANYPNGRGPQGDAVRITNFVRLVRGGKVTSTPNGDPNSTRPSMTVESTDVQQNQSGGGKPGQNGQPSMGGTPPQAAINACSASTQGSACSFTSPRGTVSGTCQTIQQQLACVPANRP
jgi:hypothetical protein